MPVMTYAPPLCITFNFKSFPEVFRFFGHQSIIPETSMKTKIRLEMPTTSFLNFSRNQRCIYKSSTIRKKSKTFDAFLTSPGFYYFIFAA
jgi:hypothetical protein